MKAGILRQKHPDWDGDLWELLGVLYEGGFEIGADAAVTDQLLPKHINESMAVHSERKRSACYVNYFGDVVDYFGAQLFTKSLTMLPGDGQDVSDDTPYQEFSEDADGKGHTFQELMAKSFICAAVTRKALVAVDFPRNLQPATSRLEERETGRDRPRAFLVDPEDLLDWKKADDGSFEWAILYRRICDRDSPEGKRDRITDSWKIWSLNEQGFATWRLFEKTRKLNEDPPKDEDEIPEVDGGVTSFRQVPLVEFMLPKGLWIGNKVGPMALEHFRRRTHLVTSQQKSLMAIPVLKLGPEIGAARAAQPSEAQQSPHRGADPKGKFDRKGWVRIGADDDLNFAEPEGRAYEIEATQLKELVDEIFRVSHLMAQSIAATGQALHRSGVSKVEDRNATEVVLEALGDKVGKFAIRIFDVIAAALNDDVFWQAKGLSEFRIRDRAQVVEEGQSVRDIKIPSKTFKRNYFTQVALRLLDDLTPEDETAIRDEIEEATDKEEDQPGGEFGPLHGLIAQLNQTEPQAEQGPNDAGEPTGGNSRQARTGRKPAGAAAGRSATSSGT